MKRIFKPQPGKSANIPHTDQDESKKRKHSTGTNAGHFQSSIVQGRKVQFKMDSGEWVNGTVSQVWLDKNEYDKKECKYIMQIKVLREEEDVIFDVPSYGSLYENIPSYSFEKRVRLIDPISERLSEECGLLGGSKMYLYEAIKRLMPQSLKMKWKLKVLSEASDEVPFDFNTLFQHLSEHSSTHCFEHIMSMIEKDEITCNLIDEAANKRGAHKEILNVIAYVTGLFVAIEMDYLNVRDKKRKNDEDNLERSFSTVKSLASSANMDNYQKLKEIDCPITKVVLFTVMGTVLTKKTKVDPKASLYQSDRRKSLFSDNKEHATLEKRCSKLVSALTSIHSAQTTSLGSVGSLGWNKLVNGLLLYLDRRGISEMALERMSTLGYTPSPRTLRDEVNILANDLHKKEIRKDPPEGHIRVKSNVFDNADVHIFGGCVNLVSVGDIHLFNEKGELNKIMNEHYVKELPIPCQEHASIIQPTKEDDEVAQEQINIQNYYALLNVFIGHDSEFSLDAQDVVIQPDHTDAIKTDAKVTFKLCAGRDNVQGRIVAVDNNNVCMVEYEEDNGDTARVEINANLLRLVIEDNRDDIEVGNLIEMLDNREGSSFDSMEACSPATNSSSENDNGDRAEDESVINEDFPDQLIYDVQTIDTLINEYVKGVDDGGDRMKVDAATTIVTDVIKDLSSKNSEATWQVLQRYIHTHEDFHEFVHCFTSDQEFMPQLYRLLLLSLHSKDKKKRLPLVLPLAMGHAIKSLACSMMTFYRAFFDEIFKGIGITIDSPKHRRYLDGKHIRESVRFVVNSIESLRSAYAKQYLEENGDKQCIECHDNESKSPNAILLETVMEPSSNKSILALDQLARPQNISASNKYPLLARHFQDWVEKKSGITDKRVHVGPSGYVIGKTEEIESLKAESLSSGDNSNLIPTGVEPAFHIIWSYPYRGKGEEPGIYSRCKTLAIVPDRNRSFQALAMRLYLFRKTFEETGDEHVAVQEATKWNPDGYRARPKVSETVCPTSVCISNLLFGSESYALLGACLFTKVKCAKKSQGSRKCQRCERYLSKCRCTHHHKFVVILKAALHSVFMRIQPHYQRLILMQLIHVAGICSHPNDEVFHGAMMRIEASWTVSESGDSYNMEPVDMLQENRVVRTTKSYGTRDINALKTMASRVVVVSAAIAIGAEKKWEDFSLPLLLSRTDTKKKKNEERMINSICNRWKSILTEVSDGQNKPRKSPQSILGTQYSFNDIDLIFNRQEDASFYRDQSVSVLLMGFNKKLDVSLPPRSRRAVRTLHSSSKRSNTKITKNVPNALSLRKQQAAMMAKEALHEVSNSPHEIKLNPDNSLFKSLDTAGTDKHDIIFTIMNQLESNKPYYYLPGRLGREGTIPIHLSKIKSEAYDSVRQRCIQSDSSKSPLFTVVDFLKDLQIRPPRRNNSSHPSTIRELARDILEWAATQYGRLHSNTVILVVDVDKHCSMVRQIQRIKRHKLQNIEAHFEKSLAIKDVDDPLSSYGEYGDLMRNEKATFVPYLCDIIMNEMKAKDNIDDKWFPKRLFAGSNLAFVGGGSRRCAFIGSSEVICLSSHVNIKLMDLELLIKPVVNQGEGERMLFSILHRIISHCFCEQPKHPLNTVFCLHSDDSDVIAGMSMSFVSSLVKSCTDGGFTFEGSILVKGPNKSATSLTKLRPTILSDLGIANNGEPTGNGFVFHLDIISLYYHFLTNERFVSIPAKSRPLLIPACFAFMNNDYMPPCNGLKYSDFFDAVASKQFKSVSDILGPPICSPVFENPIVFGEVIPEAETSFRFSGINLIFSIMMMLRTKTKAQMLRSLTDDEFHAFICTHGILSYDMIRAMAILAAEPYPVPDQLSLIARISCANFILRQWTYCVYEENVTPQINDSELCGTFWNISSDASNTNVCEIHYNLLHHWSKGINTAIRNNTPPTNWDISTWQCFKDDGLTFPFNLENGQMQSNTTFDTIAVLSNSFMNKGHSPSHRIDGKALVSNLEATSPATLKALLIKHGSTNSYNNRSERAKKLTEIFTLTMTSVTAYNATGGGRPLLVSSSSSKVCTGGYKGNQAYEIIESWPNGCEGIASKPLKDIFKMLKQGEGEKDAVSLLTSLSEHLLIQAGRGDITESNNLPLLEEDECDGVENSDDEDIFDDSNGVENRENDDEISVHTVDLLEDGLSLL